jgi:hypothetical protein
MVIMFVDLPLLFGLNYSHPDGSVKVRRSIQISQVFRVGPRMGPVNAHGSIIGTPQT